MLLDFGDETPLSRPRHIHENGPGTLAPVFAASESAGEILISRGAIRQKERLEHVN